MFISLDVRSFIFFLFIIAFYQKSVEGSLDLFLPLFFSLLVTAKESSHFLFAQIHPFLFKTRTFLGENLNEPNLNSSN